MPDEPTPNAAAAPAGLLHERCDDVLARVLGRDLMTATIRLVLLLAVTAAILATIAALVG